MKTIHIVPHSHWDREWYLPFEKHRYLLVKLFDTLIPLMESRPEYKFFHMDGQTIAVEDYLKIRPYMEDRLMALIRADRIQIGPWYILQDEYLISGEANIRNMQIGLKLCKEMGAHPVMVGYFPDSFGNISQAPQIIAGFGIDTAIFGRGITRMGSDNKILEQSGIAKSEILWKSPDGTEVLGVMLANWYNNASELPVELNKAKDRGEYLLNSTSKFSLVDDLLGMNGSDHQPIQVDLPEAIDSLSKALDGKAKVIHSNIKNFINAVKESNPKLTTFSGEIAGQMTDGYQLLINTASSRIYLKQKNHAVQSLLESETEPVSTFAYVEGAEYEIDFLEYSWKRLLENHAHDSICGCSVDEVHNEMMTRFSSAEQTAQVVRDTAMEYLANSISADKSLGHPIVVFTKDIQNQNGIVKTHLDLEKDCDWDFTTVFDSDGVELPTVCKKISNQFTYTLPDDKFRQVKYVTRFELEFLMPNTQGLGYTTVYAREGKCKLKPISANENITENEFIKLCINEDGTLKVTNKASGVTYNDWLTWENTGDIGNEYNYLQSKDRKTIFSNGTAAKISLIESNALRVVYKIDQTLSVPESRDGENRSSKFSNISVSTNVSLYRNAKQLMFDINMDNQAKDHRLRALFPAHFQTDTVHAHGHFDVVVRPIKQWEGWINPCNTQRMESFVELHDDNNGVLIATKGLHEYEVLEDSKTTLAITVLRSIGELGDWGVFPTPGAQCIGPNNAQFAVEVFSNSEKLEAYQRGLSYARGDLKAISINGTGTIESSRWYVRCSNSNIAFSSFMKAEKSEDLILRVYNLSDEPQTAELKFNENIKQTSIVRLDERVVKELAMDGNSVDIFCKPHEIITVQMKIK